jgi:hypothetical protein
LKQHSFIYFVMLFWASFSCSRRSLTETSKRLHIHLNSLCSREPRDRFCRTRGGRLLSWKSVPRASRAAFAIHGCASSRDAGRSRPSPGDSERAGRGHLCSASGSSSKVAFRCPGERAERKHLSMRAFRAFANAGIAALRRQMLGPPVTLDPMQSPSSPSRGD